MDVRREPGAARGRASDLRRLARRLQKRRVEPRGGSRPLERIARDGAESGRSDGQSAAEPVRATEAGRPRAGAEPVPRAAETLRPPRNSAHADGAQPGAVARASASRPETGASGGSA